MQSNLTFGRHYKKKCNNDSIFLSKMFAAIPKPVGLYPLNKAFGGKDAGPNHENGVLSNVDLATGPDGKDYSTN